MEIILKEDIIGLGFKNDIVNVKNGYANNYLVPSGKAAFATESAKKVLAEDLRQKAHKLAKIKAEAEALAAKIAAVPALTIPMKVSATGTIYGSVTGVQIAEGLAAQGVEVDRKKILVGDVKAVGSYTATIKLHKEVTATVDFTVINDNEPATEEEAPAVVEETPAVVEEVAAVEEETPAAEEPAAPAEEEAEAEAAPAEEV
ncbi:MAG: 50S ribosomal protein L9 [Bacteroidaceae bacterium]|nr:50S ribosomal protein L9 [Bacteroidaceae bacterium]